MVKDLDKGYGALGFEFHQNRLKKFKKGEVVLCMGVGNNYDLPFGWESPFIYSKFVEVFGEHFVATEDGGFSIDRIFKVDKEYRFYVPQIDMHFISYFRMNVEIDGSLIHFEFIDENPTKQNFAIPVKAKADYIKNELAYTHGIKLFELRKGSKNVATKSVKPVKNKTEQVPFITDLHGCKCHPFASWKESDKAHKQKFEVGDQVINRCNKKVGFVNSIASYGGYLSVKYGKNPSDIELKHSAELEILVPVKSPLNKNFKPVATKSVKPVPVPSADQEPKTKSKIDTTAKRDKKANKRDEIIKFRVTSEVKELIQELAKYDQCTVAELLKRGLKKHALTSIRYNTPFDFSKLEIIQ